MTQLVSNKSARRRRPCGPYVHLINAFDLKQAIETTLKAQPSMTWDLAREFGYSESTIRMRLLELQQAGRAHRIESRHHRTHNKGWLWIYGPEPESDVDETAVDAVETPHQITAQRYPSIQERDPFVAALFGPPRQVAIADKSKRLVEYCARQELRRVVDEAGEA